MRCMDSSLMDWDLCLVGNCVVSCWFGLDWDLRQGVSDSVMHVVVRCMHSIVMMVVVRRRNCMMVMMMHWHNNLMMSSSMNMMYWINNMMHRSCNPMNILVNWIHMLDNSRMDFWDNFSMSHLLNNNWSGGLFKSISFRNLFSLCNRVLNLSLFLLCGNICIKSFLLGFLVNLSSQLGRYLGLHLLLWYH